MRVLLLLVLAFLTSCTSQKDSAESVEILPPAVSCPEGGDCVFEVIQNSRLELKRDSFGKLYPQISKGDKTVLRYEYKKDTIPDTQDGYHSEIIFLELHQKMDLISLKDEELQQVKMTFGRLCYCKDAAGYFPVTRGHLFISRSEKSLLIKTKFKVGKVPQILTEIEETLDYYPKN